MAWSDTRGAAGTITRSTAHTEDAKRRVDESTRVRAPRTRNLVLAGLAGALLLVGGTAVAVSRSGGPGDPTRDRPGPVASATPAADASPTAESGLPLAPTTTDVTYRAVVTCTRASKLVVGGCSGPAFATQLSCPRGTCTLGFWISPTTDDNGGEGVTFTFQAGVDSISYRGQIPDDTGGKCPPQPVTANGSRGPDGGYVIAFDSVYRAGNGDGTCDSSPGSWRMALSAPG